MAEMSRMMANIAGGQKPNGALMNSGQKKAPELKATLYTWRERLPNKWDSMKEWDDIFCWRNEVHYTLDWVQSSAQVFFLWYTNLCCAARHVFFFSLT